MANWQQLQKPIGNTTIDANLLSVLRDRNQLRNSGGNGMDLSQLTGLLGQFGGTAGNMQEGTNKTQETIEPSVYGDPEIIKRLREGTNKGQWATGTLEGATRGGQLGSIGGPWGTAIGAGVGGLLGYLGNR
jgi:hypothetical protein